jgi:hypothetical protein
MQTMTSRLALLVGITAATSSLAQLAAPPAAPKAAAAVSTAPATPVFARVSGDGSSVSFAWYSAKGATGYEVRRSPDQQSVATLATLPSTTLGYEDRSPVSGPVYYQLVARGLGGSATAGAWLLYEAPAVTSAVASGADVVVSWSGVRSAPGGYEIWRTPDRKKAAVRVGAVGSTTLEYRDKEAGSGPLYYRVVARGAGGASATSAWYPFITRIATIASNCIDNPDAPNCPGSSESDTSGTTTAGTTSPAGAVSNPKGFASPLGAPALPAGVPPASLSANAQLIHNGAEFVRVDVNLAWPAADGAAGYLIIRDGARVTNNAAPVTTTSFVDTDVDPGTHVYSVASLLRTAAGVYVEGQLTGLPSAQVHVTYPK